MVRGGLVAVIIAVFLHQLYRAGWLTTLLVVLRVNHRPCGLFQNATEFLLIADRVVIDNQLRWAAGARVFGTHPDLCTHLPKHSARARQHHCAPLQPQQ